MFPEPQITRFYSAMIPIPTLRALAAAVAAGLVPAAVEAAVVYSGLQDIPIPTTFEGVYIDIDGVSSSGSPTVGWDVNPFFGGSVIAYGDDFQAVSGGTSNTAPTLRLDPGTMVDGTLVYAASPGGSSTHMGAGPDGFAEGAESYFGFRFTTNGSEGVFFGWVRLVVTANQPGGVVKDWAYDDSGAPIVVGAIPEPSVALLVGVMPLAFLRRRRR